MRGRCRDVDGVWEHSAVTTSRPAANIEPIMGGKLQKATPTQHPEVPPKMPRCCLSSLHLPKKIHTGDMSSDIQDLVLGNAWREVYAALVRRHEQFGLIIGVPGVDGLGGRPRPLLDKFESGLDERVCQWSPHFFGTYAGKDKHAGLALHLQVMPTLVPLPLCFCHTMRVIIPNGFPYIQTPIHVSLCVVPRPKEWMPQEQDRIVELAVGAAVIKDFTNTTHLEHIDAKLFPVAVRRYALRKELLADYVGKGMRLPSLRTRD